MTSFRLPKTAYPRRYELDIEPHLDQARFDGRVSIVLDVVESTYQLVLNSASLSIESALLLTPQGSRITGLVTLDEVEQQLFVTFRDLLVPGEGYLLTLVFKGALNDQLHGFYRSTFRDDSGVEQVIATTQFEPSDARRAFPCWDEPDFKAVFKISLVVDEAMTAISNALEESVEHLDGHRRKVTFADTMVMSTYLVAFVVGPYELTDAIDVDGVPLRVVSVPGKSQLAGYATKAAVHALHFLSSYFEIPYPGSKIDHIAVPDFAFGAMENLGCVTYRENVLLADESLASQVELQRIALVVAHETAHMWFGDLVTMKWWNGIWLNEAFATFMENATVDDFAPEWHIWSVFQTGKSAALATDGLRATRPVEFAVGRPEEAEAMFDVLTYQKGGAVLRMLEQYLGPETFRKGLNHYLRTHAYANTETSDLWNAIELTTGEPVRAIMDSWILRAGYPLLDVEATEEPGTVRLTQRQFLYSGEPGQESNELWAVPVTMRASIGGSIQQHRMRLDRPSATFSFDGPIDWLVINDGAWGFYRSRYSPELRARLHAAGVMTILDPLERFGLLNDSWATVVAGLAELTEWVASVSFAAEDDDPDVWAAILPVLGLLTLIADDDETAAVDGFIERLARPVWDRLGWEPASGEPHRTSIARARVLAALAMVSGPSDVKSQAAERFSAFLAGGITLPPDLVGAAARIAVRAGGADAWHAVLDLYRSASIPQEKLRYLFALAETADEALLSETLDLSISDEVRTQDSPFLLSSVMAQRGGTQLGFEWVERHWEQIQARFPSSLLLRVVEGVINVVDDELASRVEHFCGAQRDLLTGPRVDQILERMNLNVALRHRLRGTLGTALKPR